MSNITVLTIWIFNTNVPRIDGKLRVDLDCQLRRIHERGHIRRVLPTVIIVMKSYLDARAVYKVGSVYCKLTITVRALNRRRSNAANRRRSAGRTYYQ